MKGDSKTMVPQTDFFKTIYGFPEWRIWCGSQLETALMEGPSWPGGKAKPLPSVVSEILSPNSLSFRAGVLASTIALLVPTGTPNGLRGNSEALILYFINFINPESVARAAESETTP